MSENFSKSFESAFRVVFIIWVCFWGFFNVVTLLSQYANFSNLNETSNELGYWWLTTLATAVTVSLGVFLLFYMASVPNIIVKKKKISNLGLMIGLTAVYYLFITFMQIFATAIFKSENFARDFVFLSAWLFPSIILLVVHILYYNNLNKYNQELESGNLESVKIS